MFLDTIIIFDWQTYCQSNKHIATGRNSTKIAFKYNIVFLSQKICIRYEFRPFILFTNIEPSKDFHIYFPWTFLFQRIRKASEAFNFFYLCFHFSNFSICKYFATLRFSFSRIVTWISGLNFSLCIPFYLVDYSVMTDVTS